MTVDVSIRWPEGPGSTNMISAVESLTSTVAVFKAKVRTFYYEVLLSTNVCPSCGGQLVMAEAGKCYCSCGNALDPAIEFQRSSCCGARLSKRKLHYECSSCGQMVPSKYLFDERIFDNAYYREMMRESRTRRSQRDEAIRKLLEDSHSGRLFLLDLPSAEALPDFIDDLDDFVGSGEARQPDMTAPVADFTMDNYRKVILAGLDGTSRWFRAFPALCPDEKLDRIHRFITLVYMEHDREVILTQEEKDILVERIPEGPHEADPEG